MASEAPTVLVTGAARGLGRELVRRYCDAGARVIACSRTAAALPGGVRSLPLDLLSGESIADLVATLAGTPVDIVIHNAAIRGATGGLDTVEAQDFHAVMAVNALAPVLLTRALRPNLMAGRGRTVAFISSRAGSMTEGLDPDGDHAYRMSKAALNMAGRKLAYDDPELIYLLLHPGWIRTEMGGPDAELDVTASAAGLIDRIGAARREDSGSFQTWDGQPIAW